MSPPYKTAGGGRRTAAASRLRRRTVLNEGPVGRWMTEWTIRPGRLADLDALTEIYNHYVTSSIATFDLAPRRPEERRGWFDEHAGGRYRLWVAANASESVVGYASSSAFRPRLAYQTTVEVSVYLAPSAIGQGLGSRLYRALFDSIQDEDLHRAVAVIAQPNPASVGLHTKWGFREIGRFHEVGRKFDQYWDVAYFERPLAPGVPVFPTANP
jgi:phosphinothricin acetyltransferase